MGKGNEKVVFETIGVQNDNTTLDKDEAYRIEFVEKFEKRVLEYQMQIFKNRLEVVDRTIQKLEDYINKKNNGNAIVITSQQRE